MTREEKLIAMNGTTLIKLADKLGVKVSCNKSRTALKEAKLNVIKRILEAEKNETVEEPKPIKTQKDFLNAVADVLDGKDPKTFIKPNKPVKASNKPVEASKAPKPNKTTKEPKKANLRLSELTYKGKTKTIKEWATEINMPWPTLYDRINRNGWPIDLAIETPLGQRRPKNKEA